MEIKICINIRLASKFFYQAICLEHTSNGRVEFVQ